MCRRVQGLHEGQCGDLQYLVQIAWRELEVDRRSGNPMRQGLMFRA